MQAVDALQEIDDVEAIASDVAFYVPYSTVGCDEFSALLEIIQRTYFAAVVFAVVYSLFIPGFWFVGVEIGFLFLIKLDLDIFILPILVTK